MSNACECVRRGAEAEGEHFFLCPQLDKATSTLLVDQNDDSRDEYWMAVEFIRGGKPWRYAAGPAACNVCGNLRTLMPGAPHCADWHVRDWSWASGGHRRSVEASQQ